MQNNIILNITKLFYLTFKEEHISIIKLPISGSSRVYYRITSKNYSIIGTHNEDKKENIAFLHMSETFLKNGINVPKIYAKDLDKHIYLQEDLGDETLFIRIKSIYEGNEYPEELINIYKKVIEQLVELQIKNSKGINYSLCYPHSEFGKKSIMWDMNYFKYHFLKFTDVIFDEQLLEDDFVTFRNYLLEAETDYFLYRDFQSRNIMLHNDDVYFIDYQGGRKGALQYDLASLLYDAKANIPDKIKDKLLNYHIDYINKIANIDKQKFVKFYYAYALIRIMQALGAYGFRGLFEKKQHFIDSIPHGLKNIESIIPKVSILDKTPELKRILSALPKSEKLKKISQKDKLTVKINSFSYKKGIPYDDSGNGGGHVFDCRFINNPGRIEKYKKLCGKDKEVIDFLNDMQETHDFLKSIKQIIGSSVKNYQERQFKNLAINFGCTGGQHRSVYFAEQTASFLNEEFDVIVNLIHTEGF